MCLLYITPLLFHLTVYSRPVAFLDGRAGEMVSIVGTPGAAAETALKETPTAPPSWEVKGILSMCSLTSTLAEKKAIPGVAPAAALPVRLVPVSPLPRKEDRAVRGAPACCHPARLPARLDWSVCAAATEQGRDSQHMAGVCSIP